MINYKKFKIKNLDAASVDSLYKKLLSNKWDFLIIENKNQLCVLTKEKSMFEITSENSFIEEFKNNVFYKSIVKNISVESNCEDLDLYFNYIEKYKNIMLKNLYGDKFIFGSIAVKTNEGFITTIRGKENLDDYTIVTKVDNDNHVIEVSNKKATLNAPLLAHLFINNKVKAIVHINHEFDDELPYYEYAFPGTTLDSYRENTTSFNIKHHGVMYLLDNDGKVIR